MSEPIQYFEDKEHAHAYAAHRPVIPDAAVQTITKFLQDGGCTCDTAVDVGCGTGHQSTIPLSRLFNNVIGMDISKEQINQSPKDLPNVTFRVGRAEDLSFLQDTSVDLVCVSMAIHWLDLSVFYKEIGRVLKSGGCLAVFWFGNPVFDKDEATEAYMRYFGSSEFVSKEVKGIWIQNEQPKCPSGNWIEHIIKTEKPMTIADHISEEATTSYNQLYLQKSDRNVPLLNHKQRLIDIYNQGKGDETVINIAYNNTLLLWRK